MPSPTGTVPFRAFMSPRSNDSASSQESGSGSDGSENNSRIDRFLNERLGRRLSVHRTNNQASRRSSFKSNNRCSPTESNEDEGDLEGDPDDHDTDDRITASSSDADSPTPSKEGATSTSSIAGESSSSPIKTLGALHKKIRPRKNILGRSIYEQLLWTLENDPKWQSQKVLTRTIGFYKVYGEIGAGNFSKVKLGVHQLTREKVAIKIIDRSRVEQKYEKMLIREIACMDSLTHPNLIRLYEVIETPIKVFLISEWAPAGDMYSKVTLVGKLCEHQARMFFRQVLSAVAYMHTNGIVHRDIKAENVFFSTPTIVKVGDFGFSTIARKGQLLTTFCGSPPYAAPELFRDASYEGPQVDIWALGILLYFMLNGFLPFHGNCIPMLKKAVLDGKFFVSNDISKDALDLLFLTLRQIPCRRPCTLEIMRHPWLRLYSPSANNLLSVTSLRNSNSVQPSSTTIPSKPTTAGTAPGGSTTRNSLTPRVDSDLIFVRRASTNLLLPISQAPSKSLPTEEQVLGGKLSEAESQTLKILHEIGIEAPILDAHRPRGARSPVMGIYRIILHCLQEGRRWSPKDFVVPNSISKSNSTSNLLKNPARFQGDVQIKDSGNNKAKNATSGTSKGNNTGKGKNGTWAKKNNCCPPQVKEKSSACSIL